jgi:hypothetical protein
MAGRSLINLEAAAKFARGEEAGTPPVVEEPKPKRGRKPRVEEAPSVEAEEGARTAVKEGALNLTVGDTGTPPPVKPKKTVEPKTTLDTSVFLTGKQKRKLGILKDDEKGYTVKDVRAKVMEAYPELTKQGGLLSEQHGFEKDHESADCADCTDIRDVQKRYADMGDIGAKDAHGILETLHSTLDEHLKSIPKRAKQLQDAHRGAAAMYAQYGLGHTAAANSHAQKAKSLEKFASGQVDLANLRGSREVNKTLALVPNKMVEASSLLSSLKKRYFASEGGEINNPPELHDWIGKVHGMLKSINTTLNAGELGAAGLGTSITKHEFGLLGTKVGRLGSWSPKTTAPEKFVHLHPVRVTKDGEPEAAKTGHIWWGQNLQQQIAVSPENLTFLQDYYAKAEHNRAKRYPFPDKNSGKQVLHNGELVGDRYARRLRNTYHPDISMMKQALGFSEQAPRPRSLRTDVGVKAEDRMPPAPSSRRDSLVAGVVGQSQTPKRDSRDRPLYGAADVEIPRGDNSGTAIPPEPPSVLDIRREKSKESNAELRLTRHYTGKVLLRDNDLADLKRMYPKADRNARKIARNAGK